MNASIYIVASMLWWTGVLTGYIFCRLTTKPKTVTVTTPPARSSNSPE